MNLTSHCSSILTLISDGWFDPSSTSVSSVVSTSTLSSISDSDWDSVLASSTYWNRSSSSNVVVPFHIPCHNQTSSFWDYGGSICLPKASSKISLHIVSSSWNLCSTLSTLYYEYGWSISFGTDQ